MTKRKKPEVKRFPVLLTAEQRKELDCPRSIPWAAIEPHTWQALKNHGQSLARLAQRGGLGPDELVAVFEHHQWRPMDIRVAVNRLKQLLEKVQDLQPFPRHPRGR